MKYLFCEKTVIVYFSSLFHFRPIACCVQQRLVRRGSDILFTFNILQKSLKSELKKEENKQTEL